MRLILAAGTISACLALSFAVDLPKMTGAHTTWTGARELSDAGKQRGGKPQASNDGCRYARDNECDEPGIGTGACSANTDFSDCRYIRQGERDACRHARDGECDEPRFGTGACVQGADRTDCGDVAWLRNRNDSCETAFNGVCEEPGHQRSGCAINTDRSDCHGRQRPMTITDHFFGRDDRVRVDPAEMPWRAVGVLHLDSGESCTATLIADNVIITAAHCIHAQGSVNARGSFEAARGVPGGPYEARIVGYYVHPRFDYRRFNTGDDFDGLDWALLRIDRPLGRMLGHVGVHAMTRADADSAELYQAGFGWDTGRTLAANVRCRVARLFDDNTFSHECDTTRGDSGSALMVRAGSTYNVVGVDSNFRSNPNGPFLYIAASASSFEPYVADFVAERIGVNMRNNPGKK